MKYHMPGTLAMTLGFHIEIHIKYHITHIYIYILLYIYLFMYMYIWSYLHKIFMDHWRFWQQHCLRANPVRKPSFILPLSSGFLLQTLTPTEIDIHRGSYSVTGCSFYPIYSMMLEYLPTFALNITDFCRTIYQHHGSHMENHHLWGVHHHKSI